jgi:two-component sensor histidine kinase
VRQPLSLRVRLAVLVAGTTLPLILFAAGAVYFNYLKNRDAAFQHVLETARGIRLVLDREVQGLASGLSVLALSRSLQRGDIEAFRAEVLDFSTQFPGSVVSLADPSGQQLINTNAEPGTALPARANMEALQRTFATGRPAYSKVFTGSVSGHLVLSVDVPVFRDGKVAYDLASTLPLKSLQNLIEDQRPSDRWTVAIFDQDGINFARVPNPEETVGRGASPTLLSALFSHDEARLITTSLERIELITAFTRSPLSGWTVAAGMPTASITAPLWRTLSITAAIGIVMLAVGLWFAVRMASHIARGEALHQLLINELNHRVKNTLSTVQSVAHQTFRGSAEPAVIDKFDGRLSALGRAHNVLSDKKWESASIRDVVNEVLTPFTQRDSGRVQASGPDVRIAPSCALLLSMALHELATNAAKYGALTHSDGRIEVTWTRTESSPPKLVLTWREAGGPAVQPPSRKGFGTRLIEQSFAAQVGGSARIDFNSPGLVCTLECPLA